MRRVWLILALWAVACPAWAVDDFAVGGGEWHGMRDFAQLAEGLGIALELSNTVDWTRQPVDEPLIVVYPRTRVDAESLAEWVADGGRVMVLDDFGASEDFLARLDVTRVVASLGNLPHNEFADGLPAFPVFRPQGKHALLDGVQTVVANHPAVLSNAGGPVVAYSAGGALVYDMNLGAGKAILVGDASVFINQMLEIGDNAVFAANSLDYICRGERPCRAHVLVGSFESVGSYGRRGFDGGDLRKAIGSINDLLERLTQLLPGHELLYYLAILLGLGMAAYLTTVFPMRRMRPYSAFVRDFYRAIPEPQSEFDWNMARFGGNGRKANYALPLSILKELFEEIFLKALGLWPSQPGQRPNVETMADLYAAKYLKTLDATLVQRERAALLDLLVELTAIPPRNRVFLDSDAHFAASDLLRLQRRVIETLRRMDLEDEFKRRTRGEF